jgi:apolipoprotein D and lipocalin family protein
VLHRRSTGWKGAIQHRGHVIRSLGLFFACDKDDSDWIPERVMMKSSNNKLPIQPLCLPDTTLERLDALRGAVAFSLFILFSSLLFVGCGPNTKHIPVVSPFEVERYEGKWYEIARLPHSFENGLSNVTATYTQEDGYIEVINRGYHDKKEKWKEARAKGKVKGDGNSGDLSVTFFWPFSAQYKVIALDQENYQWAVVTSHTSKYYWILSRTPEMDDDLYNDLVKQAEDWGFETEKLVVVPQEMAG